MARGHEQNWNLAELRDMLDMVVASRPKDWGQRRGPAGAVLLSLERKLIYPLVLQDDAGAMWHLARTSPDMTAKELMLAWGNKQGREAINIWAWARPLLLMLSRPHCEATT